MSLSLEVPNTGPAHPGPGGRKPLGEQLKRLPSFSCNTGSKELAASDSMPPRKMGTKGNPIGNDALSAAAGDKGEVEAARSPVSEMNSSDNAMEQRVRINGTGQTVSFRRDAMSDTEEDEVIEESEDASNHAAVSSPGSGSHDGGSEDVPFQTSAAGSLSPFTHSHEEVSMEKKEEPDIGPALGVGQSPIATEDSAVVSESSIGLERQSSAGSEQEAKPHTDTEEGGRDAAASGPGDAGEGGELQPELLEDPQQDSPSSESLGEKSAEPSVLTMRPTHYQEEGADHDLPTSSLPGGNNSMRETETTDDGGPSGESLPEGMSYTARVVIPANEHDESSGIQSLLETDGLAPPLSRIAWNESEPIAVPSPEPSFKDPSYGYSRIATVNQEEVPEAKSMTESGNKDDEESSRPAAATLDQFKQPVEDTDRVGEADQEGGHCLSEESSKDADRSYSVQDEEEIQPCKATESESLQYPGSFASPSSQNHAVEGPHRSEAVTSQRPYFEESDETVPSKLQHNEDFRELELSQAEATSSPHKTTTEPEKTRNSMEIDSQGLIPHTASSPLTSGSSSSSKDRDNIRATEMPDHFVTGSAVSPSALGFETIKSEIKEVERAMQDLKRQIRESTEDLSTRKKSDDVHWRQEEVRKSQDQINHLQTMLQDAQNGTHSLKRELEEAYVARDAQMQEHSQAREKLREELRQAQANHDSSLRELRAAQACNEELSRAVEEAKQKEESLQGQLSAAEAHLAQKQEHSQAREELQEKLGQVQSRLDSLLHDLHESQANNEKLKLAVEEAKQKEESLQRQLSAAEAHLAQKQEHSQAREELRQVQSHLDSLSCDLQEAQADIEKLRHAVDEAKEKEESLQLQLSKAESKTKEYQDLNSSLQKELQDLMNESNLQGDDRNRNNDDNETANDNQGIQNGNLHGLNYLVQIGPNNSMVDIHFTRAALELLKCGNKLKVVPKGDYVIFHWKEDKSEEQRKYGMSIKYDEGSELLRSVKRDVLLSLRGNDCLNLTTVLDIFSRYELRLRSIRSGSFVLTFTSPKPNAREILREHMEEIGKQFVQTFFPERLRNQDVLSMVQFELLPDEVLQEDSVSQLVMEEVIVPTSQSPLSAIPARPPAAEDFRSTQETLDSPTPQPSLRDHSPSGSPTAEETPSVSPATSTPLRPDSSAHAGFIQDLEREFKTKGKIELNDEDEDGLSSDDEGDDRGEDKKDQQESTGTRDVLPSTPSAGATSAEHALSDHGSSSEDSEDEADSSSSSSGASQDVLAVLMEQLQDFKVNWSAKIQDVQKLRQDIKSERDTRRRRMEHALENLELRLNEVSKSKVPELPGNAPTNSEATRPSIKIPGKTSGLDNFQSHDTPIEVFGVEEEKLQYGDSERFELGKQVDISKLKTAREALYPQKYYTDLPAPQNTQASTTRLDLDPKLTAPREADDGGLFDSDYNSQSLDIYSSTQRIISEKHQEGPSVGQKGFPPEGLSTQFQHPMQTYNVTAAVGASPFMPFQHKAGYDEKEDADDAGDLSSLGLGLPEQLRPLIKKQERAAGGMILKQPPIASPSEPLPMPSVNPKKMMPSPAMEALPPVSKPPPEAKPSAQAPDQKQKEADEALKRERAMVLIQNLGIADRPTAQTNRDATHYVEAAFRVMCADGPEAPRANTMNTILCLDVSESMRGEPWKKVKQVALDLLDGLEEKTETQGLEENVAVVMMGGTGGTVRVLQHLTNDYELARNAISELPAASGGTPIFEAIIVSIAELTDKGSDVNIGGVHVVRPRIVFVTDGRPTDIKQLSDASHGNPEIKSFLLQLVTNLKKQQAGPNPIHWVPVGNADRPFLEGLAKIGGGEIINPTREGVATLSKYFLIQDAIGKVYNCMRDMRDRTKKEELESTTYAVMNALGVLGLNDDDKKHVVDEVRRKLDQPRTGGPLDWDHVTELGGLPPLGRRVVRGPNWQWADQDGGGPGTVVWHERIDNDDWVWVLWDKKGNTNRYHYSTKRKDIVETKEHPAPAEEGKPLGIGVQVLRGKEWRSGDADGGSGSQGAVIRVKEDRKVKVRWDSGEVHEHAMDELKPVTPPPASSKLAAGRRQTASRDKHDTSAVPEAPPGHVAVWQWNEDRVTWRTYETEVQSKLEMEYRKKPQGSCLISRDHVQRRVLFKTNIERPIDHRSSSATQCHVRRQIMKAEDYDHALAYELSLKDS